MIQLICSKFLIRGLTGRHSPDIVKTKLYTADQKSEG